MIHILEPHGDDALISCFPFLAGDYVVNGQYIKIVTLGSSRSSRDLMNHFPLIRDVVYADLYEVPYHIGRASYSREFKKWKNNGHAGSPWEWQLEVTERHNGELWMESARILSSFLIDYLSDLPSGDEVLSPIGIIHPYHILVASLMREYYRSGRDDLKYSYYSDAPYNGSSWTREIESSHPQASQKTLVEIPSCRSVEGMDKEEIFRSVYPSEVKLFRFTYESTIHNTYRFYLS